MIYLIGQLSLWLVLTGAFAALAGWAFAARRSAPAEAALRRERDGLLRDLAAMAMGEVGSVDDEGERVRAEQTLRGQIEVREARIAELEEALESARENADETASELAELRRKAEKADADAQELERLRALDEARERQQLIDVRPEPPEREDVALQAWRLRYFEQRVRYLESLARPEPAAGASSPARDDHDVAQESAAVLHAADWRAREAEARAAYLEEALREAETAAPQASTEASAEAPEPETFAADAEVDMLLRWRLLYLERRVAHLQARAAEAQAPAPQMDETPTEPSPHPDRWKWRARYLEARVRHLEQKLAERPAFAPPVQAEDETEAPPPPLADHPRRKPPILSAPRSGAPDDLTLIEGVSALQQSTLYALGIYHYDQVAAWTPEHVAWIDNYLRLRGRIEDEEWIEQAAALAQELEDV